MAELKKVLIVDDDMILRQMYAERIKGESFEIVTAGDGEEAIEVAIKEKPDVILLDIMMPKMNGIDAMKRLRAETGTKSIPIVVLTALLQQIDQIKGLVGPRDSYLIKSETMPAAVVDKIKEAVS